MGGTESMLDPFFFSNDYGILDGMGQLASMNMNSGKWDTRAILYRPTAGKDYVDFFDISKHRQQLLLLQPQRGLFLSSLQQQQQP